MSREKFESKLNDNPAERKLAAWSALAGGISMMGAAALGVLSNEAATPQEALGSVSIADRTYYVEAEELPLIALGGIGAVLVLGAGEYLRKHEEE